MSITGSYDLTSNENYGEWLTKLGVKADSVERLVAAKPHLEIAHNGDKVEVKTVAGEKSFTNTITLGQDSKTTLPGGIEYTINLNLSGSTLKGTWKLADKSGSAQVDFTASGATQIMTFEGVTAKRIYARK